MTARPARIAAVLALAASVVVPAPAASGPPTDAVSNDIARIFALLDDPELKTVERAADRHRALRAVADEVVDFPEAARRTLGVHWEARTPAERTRFVQLFANLIAQGYLARLSHDGERVVYDSETVNGKEAMVRARALAKNGDVTPVQFHLVQGADGRWRIYDVAFEGMSLVGNYRAQFNKIIRASSYETLVSRLESKAQSDAQATSKTEPSSKINGP